MDVNIISQIVERYKSLFPWFQLAVPDYEIFMCLYKAHEAHPLQLEMFLLMTDKDLSIEVDSILRNFDRFEGCYSNQYWPRYAANCGPGCKH